MFKMDQEKLNWLMDGLNVDVGPFFVDLSGSQHDRDHFKIWTLESISVLLLFKTNTKENGKGQKKELSYTRTRESWVGRFDYSKCVVGCDFLALSSRGRVAIYLITIFANYFAWGECDAGVSGTCVHISLCQTNSFCSNKFGCRD